MTGQALTAVVSETGKPGYMVCGAKTRTGGQCKRPAGWGTPHPGIGRCKWHLGSTRNHITSAATAVVEAETRDLLSQLGQPPPLGHPVEALLALAAEVTAWQAILRERVAELRELAGVDKLGREAERAVVGLYERSLDRSAKVLEGMVRLDLDARRTRLLEDQGEMIANVFRAVIEDPELAFGAEMRDRLFAASSKHLRATRGQ
jgi:hypothetical protein